MSVKILVYVFKKVSKKLKFGLYSHSGRNFSGRICVHHRGGGNRTNFRIIDFQRRLNLKGTLCKVVYDPNRTAHLGWVLYENGFFSFIILSQGVKIGGLIFSGLLNRSRFHSVGSAMEISSLKSFSTVSCIEKKPYLGATVARAAGVNALLLHFEKHCAVLKLRSGWYMRVPLSSFITLGSVSNPRHISKNLIKAGVRRNWGIRPTVRGVAMNPCDHPHGGGNGKTNNLSLALNPWGRNGKGVHSKNKKRDKLLRRLFKNKK